MTISLIAVDLDGTFLDPSDLVTPAVAAGVARAREAGVAVIPVTGRPDRLVWHVASSTGLGPLGVCSNGAVIVDLDAGRVLRRSGFTGPEATHLVRVIRDRVPGVMLAADEGDVFAFEPELLDGLGLAPRRERLAVPDVAARVADGCLKLVARRPDLSSLALAGLLSPVLRRTGPEVTPDAGGGRAGAAGMNHDGAGDLAEVTASDIAWVDIGPAGLTKATGLLDVCARLGIPPAEVAAIGDHFNDLPMLELVGFAGAMGNAIPDVRDVADVIVPSNAEDGVSTFIDHVLGRR